MTKLKTSPPVAQAPKQRHVCRSGFTMKDGVFSVWNGQSALKLRPFFFNSTEAEINSTMSNRARMSSTIGMILPFR